MAEWDLNLTVKVALNYPFGSQEPMTSDLKAVRGLRNELAHPQSHCLCESDFQAWFSKLLGKACAIGVEPFELNLVWYENLREDYNSNYLRALDCAKTAYLKGEFAAELEILEWALRKGWYADRTELLRLLNLSLDASKRLQRPNLIAYYANQILLNQ